jgi:hypothetical protein
VRRVLLVAGFLVLALWAPPALAKKHTESKGLGPVITVSAVGNAVTGIGSISTASATCPEGLQAVGGGFSAPGTSESQMIVIDSYRSAVGTWTVDGLTGPGTNAATAYAYCRKNNHRVTDVATASNVDGSATATLTGFASASCPAKTQLIGGGFQTTHGPDPAALVVPAVNFAPTPKSWTVIGSNNSPAPQTMTAHAYCMRGIPAPTFRTTNSVRSLTLGAINSVPSASCPGSARKPGKRKKKNPSKLLSAGGFQIPPSTSTNVFVVAASMAEPRSWLTVVVDAMGGGQIGVTTQAICF